MNELDKTEYARLESQVVEVEKILSDGQTGNGTSELLGEFLRNAKARMNEIRPEGELSEYQRKAANQVEQLAVAALVENESRLSLGEKMQYGSFLKLDWFTKSNFEDLDQFYSNAWDRLSEEGKAQMSYRVWEGVRQGEYSFAELPENVRRKESERLYEQLVGKEGAPASLANIPAQDRADFIREYEAGNENAVAEVLSRENFSMNVSTTSSKEGSLRDPSSSSKKEVEDQKLQKSESRDTNDASDELSAAGVVFADASEVSRPVAIDQGAVSPLERS